MASLSDYSVLALFSRPDVKQWLPDEEVAFFDQTVAFPNKVEEFYNDILVLQRDSVSPNDLAKVSLKILHTCPIYALKNVSLRVSSCLVLCLYESVFNSSVCRSLYVCVNIYYFVRP